MFIRTLFLILSATAWLSSAVAQTTTTNTREFDFPAIAFGSTETLEVNAVNVAANSSAGTAASCTGSIVFRNAAGTTIGTASPFTLTTGQLATARLPFASATSSGGRVVVRPLVQLTVPTTTPRPPCSLQLSLEVFDSSTNASHVYVSGSGLGAGGGRF
jgi:hypothetical protein